MYLVLFFFCQALGHVFVFRFLESASELGARCLLTTTILLPLRQELELYGFGVVYGLETWYWNYVPHSPGGTGALGAECILLEVGEQLAFKNACSLKCCLCRVLRPSGS